MNRINYLDLATLGEAIGWTIIHTIWQFALIGVALRLILLILPSKWPNLRYGLLLSGLFLTVCWAGFTFQKEWGQAQQQTAIAYEQDLITTAIANAPITVSLEESMLSTQVDNEATTTSFLQKIDHLSTRLNPYIPAIAISWYLGVFLFSVYMIFGLVQLRRLRTQGISAPEQEWQLRFEQLKKQMGIRRKVQFSISKQIQEPLTFYVIRPVVLTPISIFTGLTPDQIEILFLHELAHIRRYDFLINMLQSSIEVLFFYHPSVWWMSAEIRDEREHCCDDLVLRLRNQPMLYAEALTHLQLFNHPLKTKLVMSATGTKSRFSKRVMRLFGQYEQKPSLMKGSFIALLLLFSLVAQAFYQPTILAEEKPSVEAIELLPSPLSSQGEMFAGQRGPLTPSRESQTIVDEPIENELPTTTNDPEKLNQLIAAIYHNDTQAALHIIQAGVDVNGTITDGRTPLIESAHKGSFPITQHLVRSGADVNRAADDGYTALLEAAEHGEFEMLKFLLRAGADVNQADHYGHTPVMQAINNENNEIADYLIRNVDELDNKEMLREIWNQPQDVQKYKLEEILRLIDQNMQVVESVYGSNEQDNSHPDIQQKEEDYGDPVLAGDCVDLLRAVKAQQVEQVRTLLKNTDPNCSYYEDGEHRSPLVAAAAGGYKEIVKLLIAANANVAYHARGDETPLMAAAHNGHLEIVKYLVAQKAEVNKKLKGDGTALLIAARNGHLEVVRYLLTQNADVNAQVSGDGTALICAAKGRHVEVAKLLLDNGADPFQVSPGDEYAMYHARMNGDKAMIKLLKQYEDGK